MLQPRNPDSHAGRHRAATNADDLNRLLVPFADIATMDLTTFSQTSYRNPILKNTELIDCLKDVGCEVTKQELQEPQRNKEKLRTLFLSLVRAVICAKWSHIVAGKLTFSSIQLEFCTGKTEADFQASPAVLAKAESMEYPSLHEDFSELKFFLALRDFLTVCGYHGFSFRDLHAPTAKRLRDQLSAIINMAKFRDEQSQVYFELCRQVRTNSSSWIIMEEYHSILTCLCAAYDYPGKSGRGQEREYRLGR